MGILPRLCLGVPVIVAAGYGVVHCARLIDAEATARRDTVAALESAARLSPGNADYPTRIAVLDATRNDALATGLRLNPWAQSQWIMQSVHEEEENDLTAAEESLRRANEVSRYYMPRWSMAAFYYRQGRKPEFLQWGRRALSVGYGAPDSLFRMAQRLGFSSAEILDALIPDVPDKVSAYLDMARRDGDDSAVYQSALKLLHAGSAADRIHVLDACEHLYTAGHIEDAVVLWNRAIEAKWIDRRPLDAARGASLAEESFTDASLPKGFDWRYATVPGVSASTSDADSTLRIEFSSNEPESCELLSQYVPLLAGRRYRLRTRYRLEGIRPGSGLQWRLQSVDQKQTVLTGLLTQSADDFAEQAFEFNSPESPLPTVLTLAYARQPGTTRIEGKLWLQSVKLELVP